MSSLKTIKDVQKLTGKVASLASFISRSADRNLPFFKTLRKVKDFQWTQECEQALNDLKQYLTTPQLLTNPKVGKTLYLYLAVSDDVMSSALVREEARLQSPVYYVSKMLQGAKKKYIQIEKLALALVTTARKLRLYFHSHKIIVLTNHPLRQIMLRLDASGWLVKSAVELGELDIEYELKIDVKAQVFADFVVEFASKHEEQMREGWMLHVDGSSTSSAGGAGILLQRPGGVEIEVTAKLDFPITNNEAEYEALANSLRMALDVGVDQLNVYTDLQLIVMQIDGSYEIIEWSMTRYLRKADALSKFRAMITGVKKRKIAVVVKDRASIEEVEVVQCVVEEKSWKNEIEEYLLQGTEPDDTIAAKRLKFKANKFTMINGELYRRSVEGPLLKMLESRKITLCTQENS
ncbi:UNVERIFIED_CONTAM: hypothetical protein Sradi_5237900 [Sesamum radiatum]|uniref:Uncharacterized protein n=1 Tax=Sesamum radiatum TaxID=300843 RepID=A0AAW2LMU6_SESRA